MEYYKIVNPRGHHGVVYRAGLNTDPLPFNPSGDCSPGGIYFAPPESVLAFLDLGTDLYDVQPVGRVYENPTEPKEFKAHAVRLRHIASGMYDVVKTLVEHGANIHVDSDYALRYAALTGQYDTVEFLLSHGSDVHAENDAALRYSSERGYTGVVRLLLSHGAYVHAHNDYALRYAALNGHLDAVELLLAYGTDGHRYDDAALRYAALNSHTRVVELLKQHVRYAGWFATWPKELEKGNNHLKEDSETQLVGDDWLLLKHSETGTVHFNSAYSDRFNDFPHPNLKLGCAWPRQWNQHYAVYKFFTGSPLEVTCKRCIKLYEAGEIRRPQHTLSYGDIVRSRA